jgi:hypothetical protein
MALPATAGAKTAHTQGCESLREDGGCFATDIRSVILRGVAEQENAPVFSFARRARGVRRGAGTIVVEPRSEVGLSASDIGEGVQVPEPETAAHAYLPYAEAWKEFDKLEKRAKGATALGWIHWAWGAVLPAIGLFVSHRIPRKDSAMLVAGFLVLGLVQLLRSERAKREFAHWPCPRCHAEWPGKKLEKAASCAICGLQLHQMTP